MNETESTAQSGLQSLKDALFLALQGKHSLAYYLRIAYDYLQVPITMCDTSFSVLACWPEEVDSRHIELRNGKHYLKLSITEMMEERKLVNTIMESRRPFYYEDSLMPDGSIFGAVRINRSVVAYIFLRGGTRGFTEEMLEMSDYLSQVLAIEMQKNESFEIQSGIKYEYFLTELLDGHFTSNDFIAQRLLQLKCKTQKNYYMLAFAFDDLDGKHAASSYYYDQLLTIIPGCMVAVVRGTLCMFLPREGALPFSEREEHSLERFLQLNEMRAGISYRFTSLVTARWAMEQALCALRQPRRGQWLYRFEDEYLEYFFSLQPNPEALKAQIHPDILLLRDHDKARKTEYLETLRSFLYCGCNAAQAAQELHIHKSTFFYRMGKMGELLDTDLTRGNRYFDYDFSLRLIQYLKPSAREDEEEPS